MIPSEALTRLLWTQFWQISLLLTIVAILTRTILRDRPRACNMLWLVTFAKCLTPPLWASPVAFFSWCQVQVPQVSIPQPATFDAVAFHWLEESLGMRVLQFLLIVWLSGIFVKAIIVAVRLRALYTALTRNLVETPEAVREAFQVVSNQLGIFGVQVCVTRRNIGPAIFGLFKKTLILPQVVVETRGAGQLEPIIAHELVHVHRWDTVGSMLRMLSETIWWFHPLSWWASREASYQCERCADADVLAMFDYPRAHYGNCLISVLETKCQLHPIIGAVGMNAVEITEKRLRSIMRPLPAPSRWMSWLAFACLCAVVLPGAALSLDAELIVPCHEFQPDLPPDYKCWTVEDHVQPIGTIETTEGLSVS